MYFNISATTYIRSFSEEGFSIISVLNYNLFVKSNMSLS